VILRAKSKSATVKISPYLAFNGDCEEALAFYATCLGATITAMIAHGGSQMEQHSPPAWLAKIMHARLVSGAFELMGFDQPPEEYHNRKVRTFRWERATLPKQNERSPP
jgi:uncharacterized glyoxalase superfamily protein PhnB